MAGAVRQSAKGVISGTTAVATFASGTLAGSVILCILTQGDASAIVVTDNKSGGSSTYGQANGPVLYSWPPVCLTQYTENCAAGITTITATFSNSGEQGAILAIELTGLLTSGSWNTNASTTSAATSPSDPMVLQTTMPNAADQANSLAIQYAAGEEDGGHDLSWSSAGGMGFTFIDGVTSQAVSYCPAAAYKVLSATTPITGDLRFTTSGANGGTIAGGILVFKAASGGGTKATATPAAGVATVSATSKAKKKSTATPAAGVATVSRTAKSKARTTATAAAGVATVAAVGKAKTRGVATPAAGVATVSAVARAVARMVATPAAGVATVSAGLKATARTVATPAAGVATASATSKSGSVVSPATATPAAGVATVSAAGKSSARGAATPAAGVASVAAAGKSTARTTPTAAAGVATVSGVGVGLLKSAPTAAAGVASVSAVGGAAARSTATPAAGVATVSAASITIMRTTAIPAAGVATASANTPQSEVGDAVWGYVLSNGKTAGQNIVEIRELLGGGLWDAVIEGTYTAADLLRVMAAVLAGKTSIDKTAPNEATVEFRAVDDSTTRVSAEMVGSVRESVTITP